tara:strand:+ start:196 stop:1173 length:978 start_codon:yes stop_codon:yes gene_type:complete
MLFSSSLPWSLVIILTLSLFISLQKNFNAFEVNSKVISVETLTELTSKVIRSDCKEEDRAIGCNKSDSYIEGCFGQWLGDYYVPASGRLYSSQDFRDVFTDDKCVLILGDSLARRLAASLAIIISNDQENNNDNDISNDMMDDIDFLLVGKHSRRSYDDSVTAKCLMFKWAPKLSNIRDIISTLDKNEFSEFTDIIIAVGMHDAVPPVSPLDTIQSDLETFFTHLEQFPNKKIIWRTSTLVGKSKYSAGANPIILEMNALVRKEFLARGGRKPNFDLLDLEAIMINKAAGERSQHVMGDSPEHFNGPMRVVFLQTLINLYKTNRW